MTGDVDARWPSGSSSIFLEVVVAPGFEETAPRGPRDKAEPAARGGPVAGRRRARAGAAGSVGSFRTAGGAVLVAAPDDLADDPASWPWRRQRPPTERELRDLDLAWRLCRGVVSSDPRTERHARGPRPGQGEPGRCVPRRGREDPPVPGRAGASARRRHRTPSSRSRTVRSRCLDAGVSAIVQPGGSMRDAEVLELVDAAGAAMLVTGRRHFRH